MNSFQGTLLLLVALVTFVNGFVAKNRTHHSPRAKRATGCYGELGCLNTDDYFDIVNRPISLLPSSRSSINTRFGLYTRENSPTEQPRPQYIRVYDTTSVKNSHFHADKPIKFLVHGFKSTGFHKWVNELGNALLEADDVNVITVDWSGGSGFPYLLAIANAWVVGGEIAILCSFLKKEFQVKLDDIHIIGHSLGAHVAGYAGARLNGTVGRISGLDPAEPFFQYMPEHARLDAGDGKFVDVIHTDGKSIFQLGFGMVQPVGHLDFYPNGGSAQPGCNIGSIIITTYEDGLKEGMRQFILCNHLRAIDLFTESVKSSCSFVAHECHDYECYKKSRCTSCGKDGSKCAKMGYRSHDHPDPTGVVNRKLYLTTASSKPFCVNHYMVTVVMQETSKQKEQKGTLKVTLYGEKSVKYSAQLNAEEMEFGNGRHYSFLISSREVLGPVKRIDFSWTHSWSILDLDSWNIFNKPKLYVQNIVVEPLGILPEVNRVKEKSVTCLLHDTEILPKNTYTFYTGDTCVEVI